MSQHRDGVVTGAGGLRIYWQAWLPDGAPRSVLVVAHGASEHSGRYSHVASRLVAEGHAVPTLIMYGTADGLCPVEGSEMLARTIGAADGQAVRGAVSRDPQRARTGARA